MKNNKSLLFLISVGLLLSGCSNKEVNVKKSENNITKKSNKLNVKNDELKVEVLPVVDNKAKLVTEAKPKVDIVQIDKIKKDETPLVVVDPVPVDAPVEKVEVLPTVDDTVTTVTKVKPTVEIVEEIPVEENPAVVIDPIVE